MLEKNLNISVITVCLNASSSIRRTIESVVSQTKRPFEYIIIDGGSTDATLDIINEYRDFITYISTGKDQGISDAFNKGIERAKGDVIGILNADDWYEIDTLQLVSENMTAADVLHGNVQYWRGGEKAYLAFGDHSQLSREMTIHHPSTFVRNSVYREFGGFRLDYRYAMDYELLLRFFCAGNRFVYVPRVLANMSFKGASDMNWRSAIKESYRAKIQNGIPGLPAYVFYLRQITRSHASRIMLALGMESAVRFYRRRFSRVRKI